MYLSNDGRSNKFNYCDIGVDNKLVKLETIFFALVAKIRESKILSNFRVTMSI